MLGENEIMVYVGIDPGQQGAVALICCDDEITTPVIIYDMPLLPQKGIDAKSYMLYSIPSKRLQIYILCS